MVTMILATALADWYEETHVENPKGTHSKGERDHKLKIIDFILVMCVAVLPLHAASTPDQSSSWITFVAC